MGGGERVKGKENGGDGCVCVRRINPQSFKLSFTNSHAYT